MRALLSALGIGTLVKRITGVRLGRLHQYPAKELSIKQIDCVGEDDNLPVISIVTPSFNQGQYIGQTINSVIAQNYKHLQYVIQDAASTDVTHEILAAFAGYNIDIVVEPDQGQADALNRGFSRTSGDVMAYLNSDDMLLPGTLDLVGRIFRDNPTVDVIYGNRLVVDELGREVGRWVLPYHDADVIKRVDYIPQETLFWRRELWQRTGSCIDSKLRFALDWDLILRFIQANAEFRHVSSLFGLFRIHEKQKTQAAYVSNGAKEMELIRERYNTKSLASYRMVFKHIRYLIEHKRADKNFTLRSVQGRS